MSNFPLDVIAEILSRLPVKFLSRYLCVSKQWYALIHSQAFINLHLRRSIESNTDRTLILHQQHATVPFDYFSVHFRNDDQLDTEPMKIQHPPLPVCVNMSTQQIHGLVFVHSNTGELAIWNPLIRRYRKLPTLEKVFPRITIALGFGYDTLNDDYKVLRVVQFLNREFDVKMYSLKSKSWKNIKEQWPKKGWKRSSKTVSVNGALHWLVAENKQGPVMILAFDLANEKFRDFATPRQPPTYGAERFLEAGLEGFLEACLEVLNGKLCFIVNLDKKDNEVWLMEEYGEGSSWTRVYKIEYDGVFKKVKFFNPLMFCKNSKKILMEKCHGGRTFLIWFDTEIKKHEKVKIRKLPHVFQTAICTGSLLLLDGDNVISRY